MRRLSGHGEHPRYQEMKRPRFISVLLLTLAISVGGIATAPSALAYTPTGTEGMMFKMTNASRAHYGRAPLRLNWSLSYLAHKHSAAMAAKGTIFHTSNLGSALSSYSWTIAGENVGVSPNLTLLEQAFMASPAHRANILNSRYKTAGVGAVWHNGVVYVTVEFLG
ncbi:MAG: CAP domain-containing protein [Actinomycetota bacterium]